MEGQEDLWAYWLLHAFRKTTGKTPPREIAIAMERMKRKRRDP